MPAATTLAVAGLALAAVGTGVSFFAGQKQAKAQKKASKESRRAAALEARRARRRTIREARIARGQQLNVAAQVGAGDSSGAAGGLSGIGAQAGANLGFSTQTEAIGRRISKLGDKAASAASLGAIGQGIAGIGSSLFANAGALGAAPSPSGPSPFTGSGFSSVRPGR